MAVKDTGITADPTSGIEFLRGLDAERPVSTGDYRLPLAYIATDVGRLYLDVGGGWFTVGVGGGSDHNVLSATHLDSLTASVVAGDLIIGNATPAWARLAKGTDGQVLTLVSGLPAWAAAATTYTDENAQDAVGGILVDSATIDFTYADATPSITASVIQAAIDHGTIGGLADDDHTQYLLVAGTRALTGNWNPGAFTIGNFDFTAKPLTVQVFDANFALADNAGDPRITWDSTDYIEYARADNRWNFALGSTTRGRIGRILGTGFGIMANGFVHAGTTITGPTNRTAGDLTGERLIVPNATLLTGLISQFGGPIGLTASGVLRFYDDDNSNYVGIKSPATAQSENWVINLPSDDPAAGEFVSVASVASPSVLLEYVANPITAHEAAADPHTGYVLESLLDVKGDIYAATADNTVARLAVGANKTILGADSATATGLKYLVRSTTAELAGVAVAESAGSDETVPFGDHAHAHGALGAIANAHAHGDISTSGLKETKVIMAQDWRPASTQTSTTGPGGPTFSELAGPTNDSDDWYIAFTNGGAKEYAVVTFIMPDNYDGGTITYRVVWMTSSSTSTHTAVWGLAGRSYGNGETVDQAYGTAIEVSQDATATAYQVLHTSVSSAVTLAGTPAGGEYVKLRIYRDPTNGSDDLTVPALLIGVVIEYGITALSS